MGNPFEKLRISNLKESEILKELEEYLQEQETERKTMQSRTLKKTIKVSSLHSISTSKDILGALNERFILGLPLDRKIFSAEDYETIYGKIEDISRRKAEATITEYNGARAMSQAIYEQWDKSKREIAEYQAVLDAYKANPDSIQARDALFDLFLRKKYEERVIEIAQDLEKTVPPTSVVKNSVFQEEIQADQRFAELYDAYQKVATAQARADLIPEMYVKSRNADPSGITVFPTKDIRRLLAKEQIYNENWKRSQKTKTMAQRDAEGIPENQLHDYGWGVVLREPTYLIKGRAVDTPDFKGKITVEDLGHFSEEMFFTKRRYQRERRAETAIDHVKMFKNQHRYRIDQEQSKAHVIREKFWLYEATKHLYDNIYRVTKTDTEGQTRTDIIFSPITLSDFDKTLSLDFFTNVYLSNYMLDIARQNGGYAGAIITSPKGISISNRYSEDEIASAVLFSRGTLGNIYDYRRNQEKKYYDCTRDDFLKLINMPERTRMRDE